MNKNEKELLDIIESKFKGKELIRFKELLVIDADTYLEEKIKQEIDRVLTEYNFDRMSFDEASKQLFDLYVVVASFKCRKEEIFGEDKCKKECEDCLEYYKSN